MTLIALLSLLLMLLLTTLIALARILTLLTLPTLPFQGSQGFQWTLVDRKVDLSATNLLNRILFTNEWFKGEVVPCVYVILLNLKIIL